MSDDNGVKWLYPGAEEINKAENQEMSENKESVESSPSKSPAKTPSEAAVDISQKMTAATSYVGSLFQNSWYGGSGKAKEAQVEKNEEEKQIESEEIENTATDSTQKSSDTGSGIAKSTSAFFSSLVSGVSKVTSPTEEKSPPIEGEGSEENASQSGSAKPSGFGMLSSAFSKISLPGTGLTNPLSPTAGEGGTTPVDGSETQTTQENQQDRKFSITSAFSKVGTAASSYSKVLTETVAPMFKEFEQEQQNFIKSKGEEDIPVSPWSAYENEDELKEKILLLSADQRNFLRAPPAGVEIEMDSAMLSHHALFLLKEDPRLEKIRYELVPKQIKEDGFWKNYFYRVGVLQQSYEMKPVQTIKAKEAHEAPKEGSEVAGAPGTNQNLETEEDNRTQFSTEQDDEFISDSHQVSSSDLLEADEAIKKLGLAENSEKGDAEWEAELEGELEYEMIEGATSSPSEDNPEWEQQIQEMLDAEETGGK